MREDDAHNETIRLLTERGSCRNFLPTPMPEQVLQQILRAGIQAPTGGNLQPYSIIRVETSATKNRLAELCGDQTFIAEAPVNLVFCIDWHRLQRWAELEVAPFSARSSFRHFWISIQDTIICAQSVATAAEALGLGSVYVGGVVDCLVELKELLQLPDGVLPVVLLSIGYPKGRPGASRRLGVEMVVHSERYDEPDAQALVDALDEKYGHRTIPLSPERLQRLREVCRKVHGEDVAQNATDTANRNGFINMAQRYFGLHYPADLMAEQTEKLLKAVRDLGFTWFEEFKIQR